MSERKSLAQLEYPRHLHKPFGAFLHVNNAEEAAQGLTDGWSLDVPPDPVEAPAAAGDGGAAPAASDAASPSTSDVTAAAAPVKPARKPRAPKKSKA